MAMVNQILTVANPNVKDSRWLTLEVCREYQRSKCSRTENECKFAHPPPHVEVQNGRVIACFDSIKGKCQRKEPPCKYLHPPQHLREQLLQNGRNNLILKNLQMQAMQSHILPSMPMSAGMFQVAPPYLGSAAPSSVAANYAAFGLNPSMQTVTAMPGSGSEQSVVPQQVHVPAQLPSNQQKVQRADRLESVPGVAVPAYKRMAVGDSKSGLPMYQPQPYPQAATLMQMPYIPVSYSSELMSSSLGAVQTPVSMPVSTRMTYTTASSTDMYRGYYVAGHPPSVPRF